MRRTLPSLLLALALVALPRSAAAVLVEIPLPELAGTYDEHLDAEHVATFHLATPPSAVRSAWLRVRGTAVVSRLVCLNDDGSYRYMQWQTALWGEMPDTPGHSWWALFPTVPVREDGAVDVTVPVESFGQATWSFLNDGEGTFYLSGSDAWDIPCAPAAPLPSFHFVSVTLILDLDFAVPAVASTWGRLKAAYH